MKKRIIACLTAAVFALALLGGCAKDTAQQKDSPDSAAAKQTEKELTKVTLNEVAHSIFYAPQYTAI